MRCRTEMYAEYFKKYFHCSEMVVSQCILTERKKPVSYYFESCFDEKEI